MNLPLHPQGRSKENISSSLTSEQAAGWTELKSLLGRQMIAWQEHINSVMKDGLCRDAAVLSIAQKQFLAAHQGGILAKLTKPEIEALLGRNRENLLTHGLTLGGLKCLVIRDNLYTDAHQHSMDLRIKLYMESGESCTHAITVVLVNPVCLILIGRKGIQGGTLNMKAFEMAHYITTCMNKHAQ